MLEHLYFVQAWDAAEFYVIAFSTAEAMGRAMQFCRALKCGDGRIKVSFVDWM